MSNNDQSDHAGICISGGGLRSAWLLEPMIHRAGFDIEVRYTAGTFDAEYILRAT